MRQLMKVTSANMCLDLFFLMERQVNWYSTLLTNKLIGPYDRSRGGRAESEALITG